ncbi:hypothetical protein LZ016_01080 [Sphingomonas sp. SM33]|uniref:Glucosamine inositolphosphorylceramide transferase 1 N-terminal domain-containing protein n=1 Tax=Sphingomonas telluris TaxID=2907998 RepID=A0ABS9VIA2_9SPHN|nr:hypothetical protein [Sphingomonas telluris]MCH8614701.1 hypothetical protein [Sphingomonas telluris]
MDAAIPKPARRSASAWLAAQWGSLFRHQQWTLGLIRMPVAEVFEWALAGQPLPLIEWMPERSGRFLADPMAIVNGDSILVLAEEFDWATGLGHISEIHGFGLPGARSDAAIRSPHHLSYPYLVREGGHLYCIPECGESGRVTLYRREDGRWVEHKVLIDDFSALDSTVFQHEGRWWLFCTNAENGPNEILHAWYADDLFGAWTPHAANPIKRDIASARPAGPPFVHDGHLIRPAQDCSKHYGGSLVFNRIVKLSPEEFEEERVAVLAPDPRGPYPAGLHTICGAGDWTIVDGARYAAIPAETKRALARKFVR